MRVVLGMVLVLGAYAVAQLNGYIDLPRAALFGVVMLGGCVVAVEIVLGLRGL